MVNLGTEERTRVIDAVHEVLRRTGHRAEIKLLHHMPTGPLNRVASNRLARRFLGWEPQVRFLDGLQRSIDSYFASRDRERVSGCLAGLLTERGGAPRLLAVTALVCYFIQSHRDPEQAYRLVRTLRRGSARGRIVVQHNFAGCHLYWGPLAGLPDSHLMPATAPQVRAHFSCQVQPYLDLIDWLERRGTSTTGSSTSRPRTTR